MLLTGCLASCQAASPYNQKHPQCLGVCLLEGANLLCLQPFGTFTDLKLNLLIFHQGAETTAAGAMKPKPFSALNHFTVPCAILLKPFLAIEHSA